MDSMIVVMSTGSAKRSSMCPAASTTFCSVSGLKKDAAEPQLEEEPDSHCRARMHHGIQPRTNTASGNAIADVHQRWPAGGSTKRRLTGRL